MRLDILTAKVKVPEGVSATMSGHTFKAKGKKGEDERKFADPKVNLTITDNTVVISAKKATKKDKTTIGTIEAHVKNMMKGVAEGHIYKLKICSGHFPMNVAVAGSEFSVSNFLGEKTPRKLRIKQGATVKLNTPEVVVESINKETAGQVAADIETLTKVKGRDKRIFQDGIFITSKDGKDIQ